MKPWMTALIGLVLGAALGAGVLFALLSGSGASSDGATSPSSDALPKTGTLRLVCDLELDNKGKDVLGINPSEAKRIATVGIDFDRSSGWYDGALAISESRPGTLTVDGDLLKVNRPAMFQRFGAKISGESFTVNRKTGEFQQQLTINTGFELLLIRGQCARLIKAPF
ncbi:MAG: hypothetical protein RLY30_1205 [Pseudomonadota bacterium]